MFDASKYEKAIIYFEEKTVHLEDGHILPITLMWTKKGQLTEDWTTVSLIQAGKDDTWVNLRLLD